MSLTQGFPSTFSATQGTNEVLHNLDNETKKIYNDVNAIMAADGHSHTGNGSDGAKIVIPDGLNPTGAMHQRNPVSITSALGVLTLLETSNSFIANGTEAITSITGWTKGLAYIRWNTTRTLMYNATSLILQNAVNRLTAIGDVGVYEMTSAGAREILYLPAIQLTNASVQGSFKNLKIKVTSDTQVAISADQVVLFDARNNAKLISDISSTLDKAIVGANGLDVGVITNSTWYYVYAIAKADGTNGALMSLSVTSPTMPSGYVFKARIGAIRTHTNGTLLRTLQCGLTVQYVVTTSTNTATYPTLASGAAGTISSSAFTGAATSIASFVPITASQIKLDLINSLVTGSMWIAIAPNTSTFGGYASVNPPPVMIAVNGSYVSYVSNLTLESTNVYCACNATGGVIRVIGWEDNI